jgi:hypothetical protein
MNILIIMPVLNQFQLGIECIESIRTDHNFTIRPVLNYRHNWPLSGVWNYGVDLGKQRGDDFVLVINDDILFSPWTIDNMVKEFGGDDEHILMVTGHNVRGEISSPEEIYEWPDPLEGAIGDNPDFACFMVRPDIFDQVGRFDENFAPAYYEDNDYHRRISLSGNRAVSTTSAPYYHYGSRTQNATPGAPTVPPFAFQINQLHYISKWGGLPGHETHKTPFGDPMRTFKDW